MTEAVAGNGFRRYEIAITFTVALAMCLIFLATTNNLTGDYFYADDHEFLEFLNSLNERGFWKTYIGIPDISGALPRIRFFYFLFRLFEVKLLGANLFAHHLIPVIFTSGALSCLYAAARAGGMTTIGSSLCAFVIYAGPQAEVIYRLGTSETQGMFFLP